ncbi:hypothetical protein J437_LFUL002342 [Ladona fulva]|uniref:Uncharacterized protein n=1 Tax=Ladona fulva TaxID=123851 RepID=A0A8K0K8C8_LADFU|nr:hypothetical protein J437_LFUL002342 [Ladona fulva]
MGAQQAKERVVSTGAHSVRPARNKPKTKDGRLQGSNIFTEHSDYPVLPLFLNMIGCLEYRISSGVVYDVRFKRTGSYQRN